MEVLLALATLNDNEGDEHHTTIEDGDDTVDSFHNNFHWKGEDASIYSSIETTANDHENKTIDDIIQYRQHSHRNAQQSKQSMQAHAQATAQPQVEVYAQARATTK